MLANSCAWLAPFPRRASCPRCRPNSGQACPGQCLILQRSHHASFGPRRAGLCKCLILWNMRTHSTGDSTNGYMRHIEAARERNKRLRTLNPRPIQPEPAHEVVSRSRQMRREAKQYDNPLVFSFFSFGAVCPRLSWGSVSGHCALKVFREPTGEKKCLSCELPCVGT